MIDDKLLDKAIKSAAKAGVTVRVLEGVLQVITDTWAAETPVSRLFSTLRGTLGTLVSILGMIPQEGDCFRVEKVKQDYVVQDMMGEAVRGDLLDGDEDRELRRTPLRWGFWPLWQAMDGTIAGQTASALGMEGTRAYLDTQGAVRWADYSTLERVACVPYIPDYADKLERWRALEAVDWCWGRKDAGGASPSPTDGPETEAEE